MTRMKNMALNGFQTATDDVKQFIARPSPPSEVAQAQSDLHLHTDETVLTKSFICSCVYAPDIAR